MIAADHDRRLDLASPDKLVEREAHLRPVAIAEPADPRGETLEGDPLLGEVDPAGEIGIVRDGREHGAIGGGDVRRIAGERDPAERPLALTEELADVGR